MPCPAPPPPVPLFPHLDRSPTDLPQGSRVTIQAIEANDDAGERKRKSVGIGCNDAARPFEFVARVAVPRVAKRAQKLMRMRL